MNQEFEIAVENQAGFSLQVGVAKVPEYHIARTGVFVDLPNQICNGCAAGRIPGGPCVGGRGEKVEIRLGQSRPWFTGPVTGNCSAVIERKK